MDKVGRVANFVAVQQDVTERKASEAAFQLRDHALSNLSEGITIADPNLPDCPIVYVNDAFCRITGYNREEVIGRNCRFLQGPDTDMAALDRLRTAIREVISPLIPFHLLKTYFEGRTCGNRGSSVFPQLPWNLLNNWKVYSN